MNFPIFLKFQTKDKRVQAITPIQKANILWNQLSSQSWRIDVGSLACAKMATFWPWPAQITRIDKNKAYVKFFGDLRHGVVEKKHCVPYHLCHSVVFHYLQSLELKQRKKWELEIDLVLDEENRSKLIKSMPLRILYLQATKDIEYYWQNVFMN